MSPSFVWLSEMLAQLGWQVDIFTGLTEENAPLVVARSPYCRLIELPATSKSDRNTDEIRPYSQQFVPAFKKFQIKQETNYPLIHTFDWLSGWIGLQLKKQFNLQLIHTFNSLTAPNHPQQLLQQQITQIAERIIVTSQKDKCPLWLPKEKVEILPMDLAKSNSDLAAK